MQAQHKGYLVCAYRVKEQIRLCICKKGDSEELLVQTYPLKDFDEEQVMGFGLSYVETFNDKNLD